MANLNALKYYVERENCVTDVIEQQSVYLVPGAQVINPSKGEWTPHLRTAIHIHSSNVSQSLNLVDVLDHDLFIPRDHRHTSSSGLG